MIKQDLNNLSRAANAICGGDKVSAAQNLHKALIETRERRVRLLVWASIDAYDIRPEWNEVLAQHAAAKSGIEALSDMLMPAFK
jgi:hypothetical protein